MIFLYVLVGSIRQKITMSIVFSKNIGINFSFLSNTVLSCYVLVICNKTITVMKEYNVRRHYGNEQIAKFENLISLVSIVSFYSRYRAKT